MKIQKEKVCTKKKGAKNPIRFNFDFCYFKERDNFYIFNSPYIEVKRGVRFGCFNFLEKNNLVFSEKPKNYTIELTEVARIHEKIRQELQNNYSCSKEGLKKQQQGTKKYHEEKKKKIRDAKQKVNKMLDTEVFKLDR